MNPRDMRKNLQDLVRAADGKGYASQLLGLPVSASASSIREAYNVLRAFCSDDAELVTTLTAAKTAALPLTGV